ncbi:MAG: metallophosphoesterase, partial [Proteobacteria bacterium]|nr:metallophosphoesterase [Pseudomonadota bacterium]
MSAEETTAEKQMECLKKEFDNFQLDSKEKIEFRPNDAVVLYPSLGNPAVVQKQKDTTYLEVLILCKSNDLQRGEAAFHLRLSQWTEKDRGTSCFDDGIMAHYLEDKDSVAITECYSIDKDTFGQGKEGPDKGKDNYTLRFGQLNVFPWVLEGLNKYPCLYKIKINLKDKPEGMYNIWWVNNADYHEVKNRPKWWNLVQHIKDLSAGSFKMPLPFKKELKEYSGDVVQSEDKNKNENIRASIYHPVYITSKQHLTIGHVTDVHLDSRMELYGQSEASVIEVEENNPPVADGNTRKITLKDFHIPLKDKLANYNLIFTDICEKLFSKSADVLVITGDLVDYNRGIHTPQTYRKCFTPISEMWEALGSDITKEEHYRDDRNWFLFYQKLLDLYDRKKKPVFTMLGNHDYVNYGAAPWPLWGVPWNGVFDQNLTLYESALCFGKKYKSSEGFAKDIKEKTDYVEWYSIFINPFADFVVNYGDQSMFMVDWGVKSNVLGPSAKSMVAPVIPKYEGAGGLNHARHLFKEKSDFQSSTTNESGITETSESYQPFPIKNYSIYKAWVSQK